MKTKLKIDLQVIFKGEVIDLKKGEILVCNGNVFKPEDCKSEGVQFWDVYVKNNPSIFEIIKEPKNIGTSMNGVDIFEGKIYYWNFIRDLNNGLIGYHFMNIYSEQVKDVIAFEKESDMQNYIAKNHAHFSVADYKRIKYEFYDSTGFNSFEDYLINESKKRLGYE